VRRSNRRGVYMIYSSGRVGSQKHWIMLSVFVSVLVRE
jgi:hypothetical protein